MLNLSLGPRPARLAVSGLADPTRSDDGSLAAMCLEVLGSAGREMEAATKRE